MEEKNKKPGSMWFISIQRVGWFVLV